jgi:hypothetical protein
MNSVSLAQIRSVLVCMACKVQPCDPHTMQAISNEQKNLLDSKSKMLTDLKIPTV